MLPVKEIESHLKDILEYWKPAVDYQHGGIYCNMEPVRHQIEDPGSKCLLMHARQLYNFSAGTDLGYQGCQSIARHLYESLEQLFPRKEGIFPAFPVEVSSEPYQQGFISSYNHFYVVTAYARYAKAVKDISAFHYAYEIWKETRQVYDAGAFPENGIYARMLNGKPCGKSGNVLLHHYEALINLYDSWLHLSFPEPLYSNTGTELLQYMEEAESFFYKHLYDDTTGLTPDYLHDDLSFKKKGSTTTLGHPLEWWGFLYEAEVLTQRKNTFIRGEGIDLLSKCISLGLAESGCYRSTYFFDTHYVAGKTDFWTQIEAVLAMSYAAQGLKDPAYLKVAEKMWQFYSRFMIDKEHGGVFQRVADDGALLSMRKGDIWKCDHHALRVCERILNYHLWEVQ